MLRSNDQLTALDLSSNAIGAEGGGALLLALEAGRHALVACDLRGNQLPEARMCTACVPHGHVHVHVHVHRMCTACAPPTYVRLVPGAAAQGGRLLPHGRAACGAA
jgi:hypothetical protein